MTSSRSSSYKWLILAVLLIAALGVGIALRPSPSSAGAAQKLGVVKRGDLIQKITVAGQLIPKRRTAIMPPYNGYVRKVFHEIGDKVKVGEPVVIMSQTLADLLSQSYPIRAPFAGEVVQIIHLEGEYVQTSQDNAMIMRIDDLSSLFAQADVPELDIVKIHIGQDVIVKATPVLDKKYHGIVREIALAAREKKEWSRTSDKVDFTVKIEITDADGTIKPGMSALIDIVAAKRANTLIVRHEYIQKSGDDYLAVLENGEKRPVKVGIQDDESFEILSGLKEGDKLRLVDFLALSESED